MTPAVLPELGTEAQFEKEITRALKEGKKSSLGFWKQVALYAEYRGLAAAMYEEPKTLECLRAWADQIVELTSARRHKLLTWQKELLDAYGQRDGDTEEVRFDLQLVCLTSEIPEDMSQRLPQAASAGGGKLCTALSFCLCHRAGPQPLFRQVEWLNGERIPGGCRHIHTPADLVTSTFPFMLGKICTYLQQGRWRTDVTNALRLRRKKLAID